MSVLQVEHLTKHYDATPALRNVSLTIPEGEILGVLGPNGAGKTTLFRVLTGSLTADSGAIRPQNGVWPTIGYKPERLFFPENMRVIQYLRTMAALSNISPYQMQQSIEEVLKRVNLSESRDKKISQLSHGMRQRLGLAQALLGDPKFLILDEPTDGLDPLGQAEIIACLQDLHQSGKTILMSSHQLSEVVSVCTHIVILNRGHLIYENKMNDALEERPMAFIHVNKDLNAIAPLLRSLNSEISVEGAIVGLRDEGMLLRRQILGILLAAGYDILQIERRRATLAEIYSEVTQ